MIALSKKIIVFILATIFVISCVSCGKNEAISDLTSDSVSSDSTGTYVGEESLAITGVQSTLTGNSVSDTATQGNFTAGTTVKTPTQRESHGSTNGQTQTSTIATQKQESREENLKSMMTAFNENCLNYNITDEMLARSLKSEGNRTRIANAMKKALRGETVTVGVIGGSVTEGTGASAEVNRYANKIWEWWKQAFPKADIKFVNAGIGSTDSVLGVHRVQKDLLSYNPDFVVVEYAVNDKPEGRTDPIQTEAYENLVRRILEAPSNPGVLLLFMVTKFGTSAQVAQSKIGAHYDLPMISYHDAVYPEVQSKRFSWVYLSADTVHPTDVGHGIAASLVINYLIGVYRDLDTIQTKTPSISAPLISTRFKNATILDADDITPKAYGSFTKMSSPHRSWTGWTVSEAGQPMVLEVPSCKNVFLLLQMKPGGSTALVKVNQGTEISVKSTADSTYAWESTLLQSSEQDGKATIQITPQGSFTVLGVMVS